MTVFATWSPVKLLRGDRIVSALLAQKSIRAACRTNAARPKTRQIVWLPAEVGVRRKEQLSSEATDSGSHAVQGAARLQLSAIRYVIDRPTSFARWTSATARAAAHISTWGPVA
jgi:hypothetical protein